MNKYDYEQFSSFCGFEENDENDDCAQLMCTPVLRISNSKKCDMETLMSAFPDYDKTICSFSDNNNDNLYCVQYNLADNSSLHFFYRDGCFDFVCHIFERCELQDFSNIVIGSSTSCDVFGIDANTAFNPLLSSGPYSFHYLRDGSFLKISYSLQKRLNLFAGVKSSVFVVESIESIKREECLSVLRYIYLE